MILPPSKIAEAYGLKARKSLGQNFLFDLNITRRIVAGCGDIKNFNIIEIGPGPGGLTQAILEQDINKLYAVEFDERAVDALQELKRAYPDKLEIIHGDALKLNLTQLAKKPCAVIANLPYNISTKLLTNWFEYATHFEFFTLMFQKEVAERLDAVPRTKDYGRLSVITQWLCDIEILFNVPPSAFVPAPKVTSSVVKITPRKEPLFPADKKKLENVLRSSFGQRRKMLKSSLKSIFTEVEKTLTEIGINSQSRAEELTIEEFCKIANRV